jgi:hypothetical protein
LKTLRPTDAAAHGILASSKNMPTKAEAKTRRGANGAGARGESPNRAALEN